MHQDWKESKLLRRGVGTLRRGLQSCKCATGTSAEPSSAAQPVVLSKLICS